MRLDSFIEWSLEDYIKRGNPTPKIIYLGHKEWNEAKGLFKKEADIDIDFNVNLGYRPEYMGMKMFLVNEESFVGFGKK